MIADKKISNASLTESVISYQITPLCTRLLPLLSSSRPSFPVFLSLGRFDQATPPIFDPRETTLALFSFPFLFFLGSYLTNALKLN